MEIGDGESPSVFSGDRGASAVEQRLGSAFSRSPVSSSSAAMDAAAVALEVVGDLGFSSGRRSKLGFGRRKRRDEEKEEVSGVLRANERERRAEETWDRVQQPACFLVTNGSVTDAFCIWTLNLICNFVLSM